MVALIRSQERSFEAEREAFRAHEAHLHTRLKSLHEAIDAAATPSDAPARGGDAEQLQEELASLSAAHCTLIAQLNTTTLELADVKERNMALEEENAGWELLMRERTLNGGMRGRGLLSEDWLDGDVSDVEEGPDDVKATVRPREGRKSDLEALDEEMGASMHQNGRTSAHGSAPLTAFTEEGSSLAAGSQHLAAELGRAADFDTASRLSGKETHDGMFLRRAVILVEDIADFARASCRSQAAARRQQSSDPVLLQSQLPFRPHRRSRAREADSSRSSTASLQKKATKTSSLWTTKRVVCELNGPRRVWE